MTKKNAIINIIIFVEICREIFIITKEIRKYDSVIH